MVKFTWSLKDGDGVRATGKSPTMQIQRSSDSYYWIGSAWQSGSVDLNMSEFGKGLYHYDFTGKLQDLFVFFDESTIPRYSETFYSLSDLISNVDGLNRKVDSIVYDSTTMRVTSCTWKFSATSDFSSPALTATVSYEYNSDGTIKSYTVVYS